MKSFAYSCYGEEGANILARAWARRGHYFFEAWHNSGTIEDFTHPDMQVAPESTEFEQWAERLVRPSRAWLKVLELRGAHPRRRID